MKMTTLEIKVGELIIGVEEIQQEEGTHSNQRLNILHVLGVPEDKTESDCKYVVDTVRDEYLHGEKHQSVDTIGNNPVILYVVGDEGNSIRSHYENSASALHESHTSWKDIKTDKTYTGRIHVGGVIMADCEYTRNRVCELFAEKGNYVYYQLVNGKVNLASKLR